MNEGKLIIDEMLSSGVLDFTKHFMREDSEHYEIPKEIVVNLLEGLHKSYPNAYNGLLKYLCSKFEFGEMLYTELHNSDNFLCTSMLYNKLNRYTSFKLGYEMSLLPIAVNEKIGTSTEDSVTDVYENLNSIGEELVNYYRMKKCEIVLSDICPIAYYISTRVKNFTVYAFVVGLEKFLQDTVNKSTKVCFNDDCVLIRNNTYVKRVSVLASKFFG